MVLSLPTDSDPELTPALLRLQALLQKIVRVKISDGRIFIGSFAGTDQPLNILVTNAEEYRPGLEEGADGRYVGQVVIPWKLVKKVEVEGPRASTRSNPPQQNSNLYL
jgi:small nuclear ribonucleoprotein (snRNP)-like protein